MAFVAILYANDDHAADGNTRALAEALEAGAKEIEGTTTLGLSVDDAPRIHATLAQADAIVFGCVTSMGSASASFKAFMDSTSAVWALQSWRDKLAAAFTVAVGSPRGDKLATLAQLASFAAQHGMVWVGLGSDGTNRFESHLGVTADARQGEPIGEGDLATAASLGRRVARAARRWSTARLTPSLLPPLRRHDTTRGWVFPPPGRRPAAEGVARTNLRELAARPERFENHLVVCASVDGVELEVRTASEPMYYARMSRSDEYAIAFPTGDELVDRFPLRTFLSTADTGQDVGRYQHRTGDLVLHPQGYLHWAGRLRPPFEPFDFAPGTRRAALSLVVGASQPTPPRSRAVPAPADRGDDVQTFVDPPPPMALSSLRGEPGTLATVGRTTLSLVELPGEIAPPRGGWVVVLEASLTSSHHAADLYRIPEGKQLDGSGIVRALVIASSHAAPDPIPRSWVELAAPPFSPLEDVEPAARARLPIDERGVRLEEQSAADVTIAIGPATTVVPRYWLARLLFRVGLHRLRLGYVETYGGLFVDDRGDAVLFGIRSEAAGGDRRSFVSMPRSEAAAFVERVYQAVAPVGYAERPA